MFYEVLNSFLSYRIKDLPQAIFLPVKQESHEFLFCSEITPVVPSDDIQIQTQETSGT